MDVKHVNVTLDITDEDLSMGAYEIAKQVRKDWKWDDVQFRIFTQGLTNKLIGVYHKSDINDIVLVRIYGKSMELIIDRKNELETFKLLHDRGYAPKMYLTYENGYAFEYLSGVILTNELFQSVNVYPLVAKMVAKIHKIRHHDPIPEESMLWDLLERCIDLIPERFADAENESRFRQICCDGKSGLKKELSELKKVLESAGNPILFCHNDLLFANVIYNEKKNTVTFIDYEYAGYNYQAFDIASHFAAFADEGGYDNPQYPSENYQLEWIREYLKEFENCATTNEDSVRHLYECVRKFMTAAHFFFAVWSFMQVELSDIDFDYLKSAKEKYGEYRKALRYIQ